MSDIADGRSLRDGLSPTVEPVSAVSPADAASIPSAPRLSLWFDQRQRQMRWEVDNGPVVLTFPQVMKPAEIDDLEQVLELAVKTMRRTASGIAARSDETAQAAQPEARARPDAQPDPNSPAL